MSEIIERIPLRTVRWLKSLSFEVYCEHYEAKFIRDNKPDKKRQSKKDLKDKYNYLQIFCDNNIKSGGVMKRIYKYSLHTQQNLVAVCSVAVLSKESLECIDLSYSMVLPQILI